MNQEERAQAIARRAEELDTGEANCFDPVHAGGAEYWEQGGDAFRRDIHLEVCPYDSGVEQDDWLRGWMAAELIEFGEFDDDQSESRDRS
jgi:hypothetical protein